MSNPPPPATRHTIRVSSSDSAFEGNLRWYAWLTMAVTALPAGYAWLMSDILMVQSGVLAFPWHVHVAAYVFRFLTHPLAVLLLYCGSSWLAWRAGRESAVIGHPYAGFWIIAAWLVHAILATISGFYCLHKLFRDTLVFPIFGWL